ncbi:putative signal transducing protein [Hymenobacter weizhouensis]|uniref:putative signal transducing protein n=1 Tax=Hymenobacter sp. YIM 151500-1 TaxID=2987689 RepID=UPI0022277082|nr:DUF2007 domain-containing protein [Hymenobacter sp. YIM 151500-1]UYZ62440.1 DUF2007 domain-containing protein [Hymenobacter sp. YIM 151500-1]
MPSDSAGASAVVLLDSFTDSFAAHLAKTQLDAARIPCFLSNENRPYGAVLGAVRLFVRTQDVAAAQEVLHAQQAPMYAVAPEPAVPASTPRCPRCHHPDVVCRHQPQPTDNLFVKLRLWLLAPEKPQCHCFHCGLDFEMSE